MSNEKPAPIFQNEAAKYWNKDICSVPVPLGTKRSIKEWPHYQNDLPKSETRNKWLKEYAHCGIAILTGRLLEDGTRLAGIDVDDDAYVEPIKNIIGIFPCAKIGKKGLTIFVRVPKETKSSSIPKKIDFLVTNKLCVLPPTIHMDTKKPYVWVGTPLSEVDFNKLPFLDKVALDLIRAIIENEHCAAIMEGAGTHEPAVRLTASLAGKFDDEDMVCRFIEAFLPVNYQGNLKEELPEMFRSAKKKGLGAKDGGIYESGTEGPVPMGYTDNGFYVFKNQKKRLLSICAPSALMSECGLYDLAPRSFWRARFPFFTGDGPPGIDVKSAADTLIQICKETPFVADTVRGCGVWRDNGNIVLNLRAPYPESGVYVYVCFRPLPDFDSEVAVDPQRLLNWLQLFKWEKPGYAVLAFGWAALAVICGALDWRPHIFINGPKNSGKSTIIGGFSDLLAPMALVLDGGSSEAGIRQSIGADSRPVILDEFESDRDVGRMQRVIKLIRSASSAKGAIARGTPEGKALQFLLHSTFCLGAINPLRGTAADSSRIVNLGLAKHDNSQEIQDEIQEGLQYLGKTRSAWPNQMLEIATIMIDNIDVFQRTLPSADSRHNKNMASLMAGAFTALHKRPALTEDAKKMIDDLGDVIGHLEIAHEEDDAMECLNHLMCYMPKDVSIGHLIQDAVREGIPAAGRDYPGLDGYGVKLMPEGFLVANKHPGLEEAFQGTAWGAGAWIAALRRLPDAEYGDKLRVRFSGGIQQRCTLIPFNLLEIEKTKYPLLRVTM